MIEDALISALRYLLMVVPFIIIGVVLAELIIALKFVNKIVWITKPITRFGHLRKECGITFLTAFASPAAANSMLMDLYTKKLIERRELIISSLVNSFPAILMHWKYILPAIVPLLGVTGLIYAILILIIGFIKTLVILIIGRILLPARCDEAEPKKEKRPPIKEAFKISIKNSKKMIKRILIMIIPITFIVFILIDIGVFDIFAGYLSGVTRYFPIPVEGLGVIAAQFAKSIAAWTIAGNLLSEGVLTSKEVILTLLFGSILVTVMEFKHSIPYYLGIFGAKLGTQLVIISIILRIIITILMIIAL
ncbi:MAG: nucleoside recognition protein, partial [Candidatus Altiarchaeales archaeon HGW-Altiarchaeales-3]